MTPVAAALVEALVARGLLVGTAESLTGGLVAAAITDVPGASATLVGGVVSYATRVKAEVLGVDAGLLAARGAVDPDVARAMAEGVCRVLGADVGLATTGVAGPDEQDGHAVGTVHVAVAWPGSAGTVVRSLHLAGDRGEVRAGAVEAVLDLTAQVLAGRVGDALTGGKRLSPRGVGHPDDSSAVRPDRGAEYGGDVSDKATSTEVTS